MNTSLKCLALPSKYCRLRSSYVVVTNRGNPRLTRDRRPLWTLAPSPTPGPNPNTQSSVGPTATAKWQVQSWGVHRGTDWLCRTLHSHAHSDKNIILLGSPGSGKTTVGQILASKLNRPVLDIDNDHLEKHWGMPVAQKLSEVGGDRFVEEEGQATLQFQAQGHVISLSGSNPMHKEAMDHLRTMGTLVFLDVQHEDIVERLERMKVNRIVGQGEGVPMIDILQYRQQFYEGSYDVRVLCEAGETPEAIADKVCTACMRLDKDSRYTSTRAQEDGSHGGDFNDVVLEGLAQDGGLYTPNNADIPHWTPSQWHRLVNMSYQERALRGLEAWLHPGHVAASSIGRMVETAYNIDSFNCHQVVPVVHLERNHYIQELFHGPTASFKDAALQLMPHFFAHALNKKSTTSNERYLILVATSGDTGGAVLDGFSKISGESGVSVMVLYPENGISAIQKAQMTAATGDNVHVVGVKSDFDFCQSSIKHIFTNPDVASSLREKFNVKLSAANSINWGRLLPQVVYHTSAYLDLVRAGVVEMGQEVDLCIPTGNFGNILAAFYSKKMGIPWRRLVCASNSNNVITDFMRTGRYDLTSRALHLTSSPAIDILKSSNLERYLYHLTGGDTIQIKEWYTQLDQDRSFTISPKNLVKLQDTFVADWCSEEDCHKAIADTWQRTGYLLDPHTAVAKVVADRVNDPTCPMVISSTAHYAKFAHDVLPAVRNTSSTSADHSPLELLDHLEELSPKPQQHNSLRLTLERPRRHHAVCGADMSAITGEVENFLERCR